jgi:hypothetical protein
MSFIRLWPMAPGLQLLFVVSYFAQGDETSEQAAKVFIVTDADHVVSRGFRGNSKVYLLNCFLCKASSSKHSCFFETP